MYGKFVVLFTLVVAAQAGLITHVAYPQVDAVASTHESVVRSFDGTVSHHSKAVDTPYSSVRKTDTRVNNNVYTPALAKTVTYAAPVAKTNTWVHSQAPTHYSSEPVAYAAPVAKTVAYAAPATKTVVYSQPRAHYSSEPVAYAAPAPAYPHATATTTYQHAPNAASYAHNDEHVSAYGSSQTVHYSPANMVSHMSFDGFGTHWGF